MTKSMAADSETLVSVVNELGENEFGDSDLVGNSVVDSVVVVKSAMLWGRVEVMDWFRARLVQRTPAAGISVRSSTT